MDDPLVIDQDITFLGFIGVIINDEISLALADVDDLAKFVMFVAGEGPFRLVGNPAGI
jgi:hypothetical protein